MNCKSCSIFVSMILLVDWRSYSSDWKITSDRLENYLGCCCRFRRQLWVG